MNFEAREAQVKDLAARLKFLEDNKEIIKKAVVELLTMKRDMQEKSKQLKKFKAKLDEEVRAKRALKAQGDLEQSDVSLDETENQVKEVQHNILMLEAQIAAIKIDDSGPSTSGKSDKGKANKPEKKEKAN